MRLDDASVRILIHLDQAIGFHRDAFAGIAQAVQGYDRVILDLNWANLPLKDAVERQRPMGIILAATREAEIDFVVKLGIPCINIANILSAHSRLPVVGNDDQAVGRMVADFFLQRGFECFGYACAADVPYFWPRRQAYVNAIQAAGFSCNLMPTVDPAERSIAGIAQWIAKWLRGFEKPLAVLCPFDPDARDVAESARLAGIRVPDQVSIMGVDNDLNLCMTTLPTLSSVVTAASKIGRVALQQVLRLIEGHPAPARPILIPPTGIVERGSTGELAVADADVAKAIHFMRNNLSERINVALIAERAATSRRTLERKFLESIGRTPLEELRRLRIERAKRLLLSTDLELKEVARSSGLIHVQRLAKLVKAETGLSPARFRRTRTESENFS